MSAAFSAFNHSSSSKKSLSSGFKSSKSSSSILYWEGKLYVESRGPFLGLFPVILGSVLAMLVVTRGKKYRDGVCQISRRAGLFVSLIVFTLLSLSRDVGPLAGAPFLFGVGGRFFAWFWHPASLSTSTLGSALPVVLFAPALRRAGCDIVM